MMETKNMWRIYKKEFEEWDAIEVSKTGFILKKFNGGKCSKCGSQNTIFSYYVCTEGNIEENINYSSIKCIDCGYSFNTVAPKLEIVKKEELK